MGGTLPPQRTVIVGAGPVGGLAALYAAQRGDIVEVYDKRSDFRNETFAISTLTKSINLALSERGVNAITHAGDASLLALIRRSAVPMFGRMVHGEKNGKFTTQTQQYDVYGRYQRAIDRGELNRCFLNTLTNLPNVTVFFHHKLSGVDFDSQKATFQVLSDTEEVAHEKTVSFDFLIGADGAHSATRYHLTKHVQMYYKQEYIDLLWCQFVINPNTGHNRRVAATAGEASKKDASAPTGAGLSSRYFHIWPSGDHMFIAIPNPDGSFTATLFMPPHMFKALDGENTRTKLVPWFQAHYPGVVPELISEEELIQQYTQNPHLPLIAIECAPYHYRSRAVIVGDAAHAMVPFYGQGVNAGLEDVRLLFSFLSEHMSGRIWASKTHRDQARESALNDYSAFRHPDAVAINRLSLQNYREMCDSVTRRGYKIRKTVEEFLSAYAPWLGWETQYSRVSFQNMRYSTVEKLAKYQEKVLKRVAIGLGASTVLGIWAVLMSVKAGRPVRAATGAILRWAAARFLGAARRLDG